MSKKVPNFGVLFGEGVVGNANYKRLLSGEKLRNSTNWENETENVGHKTISAWRLVPVYVVISILLLLLFGRAFKLQLIDGKTFLNKSQGNHVLIMADYAPRGVIYDRNGKVLVRNKPGFRVSVRKVDLPKDWEQGLRKIATMIGSKPEELIKKIKEGKADSVTLETNLTNDQVISLKANLDDYPWLAIEVYPKREYLYGEALAPLLGYTGEASEADLKKTNITPYIVGDQVGKAGAEAAFEKILRGANGYQLIKVDALGKKQGTVFQTKPVLGNDITLSIDVDLQQFIYTELKETLQRKGGSGASAIVSDPKTGEILALVSAPSYDNNIFSKPLSNSDYQTLVKDPRSLLLNRPVESSFPPGSTYKLIVAAAGLEVGAIKHDTKILDTGFIQLGDVTFNNWLWLEKQKTEGELGIVRALARSNDTFFYRLGQMLGDQQIYRSSLDFGLGQSTGIELPNETIGLVPNSTWKKEKYGEIWYAGETLNMAIGQGYLLVSPLQLISMTNVFANNGRLLKPTIVKGNGNKIIKENFLKAETIKSIQEGMYANTYGDGNVAYLFSNFKIHTAGKTGSAESGGENKPHSWYTAYAPYEDPQISVTVMFEKAGHGSEVSAPVVRNIFNNFFR